MFTRANLFRLAALAALLAGLLAPKLALAASEANPCRRLWGTEEWTRRCAQLQSDIDLEAYCRRVFGTEDWNRRCRNLADDPASLCRRLWGTDEWTRRCVPDDPSVCRRLWGTDEWTRRCRRDPERPEADPQRPAVDASSPTTVPETGGGELGTSPVASGPGAVIAAERTAAPERPGTRQ